MIRVAVVLALLPALVAAQEAPVWLGCRAEDRAEFRVGLWQPSEFGDPLHCVTGIDLGGVAGCAPDGGWGLSDPAGSGGLTAVATGPREAAGGTGGKFFAHLGPSEFVASASRGVGLPLALEVHGDTFWRMRMSIESGEGRIFTRERRTEFRCEAVGP